MNNEEQRRLSPAELQQATGLTPEEIKRQAKAGVEEANQEVQTVTQKGSKPIKVPRKMIDKFRNLLKRSEEQTKLKEDIDKKLQEINDKLEELKEKRKAVKDKAKKLKSSSSGYVTEINSLSKEIKEYDKQIEDLKQQRYTVSYKSKGTVSRKFFVIPHFIRHMKYKAKLKEEFRNTIDLLKERIKDHLDIAKELQKNPKVSKEDQKNLQTYIDSLEEYTKLSYEDFNKDDIENVLPQIFGYIKDLNDSAKGKGNDNVNDVTATPVTQTMPAPVTQKKPTTRVVTGQARKITPVQKDRANTQINEVSAEQVIIYKDLKDLTGFANYEEYFDEFARQKIAGKVKMSSLLSKDTFEAKKNSQELKAELKENKDKLKEAETTLNKTNQELDSTKRTLKAREDELASARKTNDEKDKQISDLQAQGEDYKKQIESLEEELNKLKGAVSNFYDALNRGAQVATETKPVEQTPEPTQPQVQENEQSQVQEPEPVVAEPAVEQKPEIDSDETVVSPVDYQGEVEPDETVVSPVEFQGNIDNQTIEIPANDQVTPLEPENTVVNTPVASRGPETAEIPVVTPEPTVESESTSTPVFDTPSSPVMNDDQTSNIADELVRIMSGQTENNLNPLQYMAQLKEQEAREAEMEEQAKGRTR